MQDDLDHAIALLKALIELFELPDEQSQEKREEIRGMILEIMPNKVYVAHAPLLKGIPNPSRFAYITHYDLNFMYLLPYPIKAMKFESSPMLCYHIVYSRNQKPSISNLIYHDREYALTQCGPGDYLITHEDAVRWNALWKGN